MRNKMAISFTILLVISGLFITYPSAYNESVPITSNQQQVHSAHWIVEFSSDESVVGSRTTFYKIEALYGREVAKELNIREESPTETVQRRQEDYSWQVDTNESSYYFVDSPEREIARAETEGSGDYVTSTGLYTFRQNKNSIYFSGTVRIYK